MKKISKFENYNLNENSNDDVSIILDELNDRYVFFIDTTSYTLRIRGKLIMNNNLIKIEKGFNHLAISKDSIIDVVKLPNQDSNEYRFTLNNGNKFIIIY